MAQIDEKGHDMNNGEIEALIALKEIAHQLKIANKLKAWELKENHRELVQPYENAKEIENILNS